MKRIPHDPRFDHVDYKHTDLRVTFARVRRQQAEAAAKQQPKVTPITQRRAAK